MMADGMSDGACWKYCDCAMRISGSGCIVVQTKKVYCLVWASRCTQKVDKAKLLAGSKVLLSGG
jgi:predicted component of type VI protein secretion system